MKKLLANLIILMLLGALVFFFGWLPLRVPAGRHAVLVSKTNGVHPETLAPGGFFWTPAALLPTNIKLYHFSSQVLEQRVELSGVLPSAGVYQDFLVGKPDFSWDISLRLTALVKTGQLPHIVAVHGVQDDQMLAAFLQDELVRAAEDLRGLLIATVSDAERMMDLFSGALSDHFVELISHKRPYLEVLEVAVISARIPDMQIYLAARELYGRYIASYQALVEPALAKASTIAAEDQVRMNSLRRYGEVLTEYPILVDYLAIEAGLQPYSRLER